MTIRFAVVSVNRSHGQAQTIQVFDDSMEAQRLANVLNDDVPACRCAVIPFFSEQEKKERDARTLGKND